MKPLVDRPWDNTQELKNGKKVIVRCTWADGAEHVVSQAQVLIEEPGPGDDMVIATIDGPMSQEEADIRGAGLANDWYDRGNP